MKRFACGIGAAFILGLAMGAGSAPSGAPAATLNPDAGMEKVKAFAKDKLAPFIQANKKLVEELAAANKSREAWSSFSEDYKSWTPADAEKNRNSYSFGEYEWSVKKDKEFRNRHLSTPAATELKEYQKSAGAIAEFFVTDAKGGNVCQTQLTSDWFQGDEAKFKDCAEKKEIAFGKPQRDDTVGETGVHVSIPVFDADKKLVGVAVALVIIEKLK